MAKRYHSSTDSKRYYDWLDRAGEDITSALLLAKDDGCYNSAAFHCHQTIEKALKAYILIKSDILVDGHNLTWLCKRAVKYDKSFSRWLEDCATLNRCYIETRYPSDRPVDLDYSQVMSYCKTAQKIYRFICEEVDALVESKKAHPMQVEYFE